MAAKANKKQVVKAKSSSKAVKKTVAKSKASVKKVIAKKKPAPKAKAVKKPAKKMVAVKKVIKKVAKKPVAKKQAPKAAKKLVKAVKPVAVKPTKAATKLAAVAAPKPKAEKKVAAARKKKPTKLDKKMARTLVKIANANRTAVANVGVRSAAMAALKATVALSAANINSQPAATLPQPANVNQPAKEAKGEKPAFKAGDMVVYPAHGVGKVEGIEAHTVGGMEVRLFKITFDHERMTLKVPMQRATGSGLRQLSSKETMKNVFETMKGRPRIRRVMWSRRAQEYEQKINSGDPVAIAEVLRDLRRNAESGEQSYSERQIFNNALERLAREVAAIDKVPQEKAVEKLHNLLVRSKNVAPIVSNDDEAEDAA